MLEFFSNSPLLAFFICFFGALFSWFAADQFRDQILSDSHRVVRAMALRYLQVFMGLFAVFLVGIMLAVGTWLGGLLNNVEEALAPVPTETQPAVAAPTEATDFFGLVPVPTETEMPESVPVPVPTTPVTLVQETDQTLAEVKTAVIVNTNNVGANTREVPGLGGAVLTIAPEGSRVTILGPTQVMDGYTWYNVVLPDGTQGWIADRFLRMEQ